MGRIGDSPCRYCTPPKRNERCHGVCKEYADWKADIDAQAYRKHQEEEVNGILTEGAKERKRRYYKRGGSVIWRVKE